MINRWRYVEYTDEGCAIFQCLKCKSQWESRTSPGYIIQETFVGTDGKTYEAGYYPTWHFCPVCGTKWDGCERDRADVVGPRRTKIQDAIESRQRAEWSLPWEQRRAAEIAREKEQRFWLIEENYQYLDFEIDRNKKWEMVQKLDRAKHSAKEALEYMRRHREMQLIDHSQDIVAGRCAIFHRVRAG